LVSDDDGVIFIPFDIADEIADEAAEMTAYEDVVIGMAGETSGWTIGTGVPASARQTSSASS
jgi:regulator of RNase E activity RraA